MRGEKSGGANGHGSKSLKAVSTFIFLYGINLAWLFRGSISRLTSFGTGVLVVVVIGAIAVTSSFLKLRRAAYVMSIISGGIPFGFGLFLLWRRVSFVLEHGRMEGPDGYGSPAAFIVNGIWEQMLFTAPPMALFLLLFIACFRHVRATPHDNPSGPMI